MAEFAYNNAKNTSIGYTSFKFNYEYYPCISYKKKVDRYFKFKAANKLTKKLRDLIGAYRKNLYHAQKL